MSFYTEKAETSRRLLAKFGQSVTVKRIVAGTYNPETGTVTNAETEYTGIAALLDYKLQEKGLANESDSLVQSGDKKLLLAPLGYLVSAPDAQITLPDFEPNDTVTVQGVAWTVVNAKHLKPAGTTVLQELQLRK
jgi:hypothetical protein